MEQQLETLREQRNAAYETFHQNELNVAQKLTDIIKMHCAPEGVEAIIYLEMDRPWSSSKDKGRYCFRGKIGFKTDDPVRLKKGFEEDFGSNFDITINEQGGIEINKGTIGTYSSKDKYQVARDRMLCNIWDNESVIIGCMLNNFNYDLYVTYNELDRAVYRLEQDIKVAEENRVKAETLEKLKSSKYLYDTHTRTAYDDNCNKIGIKHYFNNVFIITKVTDKSIIGCYENYRWENKRLNLNEVIYKLLNKSSSCGNEIPEEYIEYTEEGKDE